SLPARKGAADPGDKPTDGEAARLASKPDDGTQQDKEPDNPNKAGIRIDLTGIGVGKPK
ncbi:conjugal transfer protein TraH, partial [Bradyrhizobium sp. Leo170]